MVGVIQQNFTCEGWTHQPDWKDILKATVICCVTLVIVVGNIFSVVVFNGQFTKKAFLKKVRLTMNSLICTDLSMGLLVCPFCVYSALYHCWPFGVWFCKVDALMISALFHESTLNLVLIALDRYFSVHHYLRYNTFMTSTKYIVVIVSTWVFVFSTYALVIFYFEQFYFDEIGVNCEPYYANSSVTLAVTGIFYAFPAFLFVFSYGTIFWKANRRNSIRQNQQQSQHHRDTKHSAVSQILKTSKYLAAISLGFFVAITPWTLCTVYIAVSGNKLNEDVDFIVTWLAISNSFWNVVIYSAMNRKFRAAAFGLMSTNRRRLRWIDSGFGSKMVDADSGVHTKGDTTDVSLDVHGRERFSRACHGSTFTLDDNESHSSSNRSAKIYSTPAVNNGSVLP